MAGGVSCNGGQRRRDGGRPRARTGNLADGSRETEGAHWGRGGWLVSLAIDAGGEGKADGRARELAALAVVASERRLVCSPLTSRGRCQVAVMVLGSGGRLGERGPEE